MIGFTARRLAHLVPILFVMSMMVFSMTLLLPGDPTTAVLGEEASPAQRERLRQEMGLDQPIPVQYGKWLVRALSGDFGTSLRTREPVREMLALRVPVTLELTFLSILLSLAIGLPAGVLAAIFRNSWIDVAASFVAMCSMAVPYFWAGLLLIMLFSVRLAWLPPSGYVPLFEDPLENLQRMILPTLTIGTAMAALVMRQTRTAMLQVLSQDYIRTARAKGVPEWWVVLGHGLRNCMIPVATVVGLQTGALVGGAVVTETIFSLPGLGRMVVEGIFWRDFAVVQGAIVVIVLLVLVVNLLTDLAYASLDPRIKLEK